MGKENRAKAEYAVSVAAALGFLSVHNMDKVSFKLIKEDAVDDPFGTIIGKNSFFRAISLLENLDFSDDDLDDFDDDDDESDEEDDF